MSILNSTSWRLPRGHWAWAGIQQQFHTWQYPRVGCPACEAEGWIPASNPAPMATCQQAPDAPNSDSTPTHLHEAYMAVKRAITHLEAICRDSRIDVSVRHKALDALRDAQTAIEAECEAGHAD